MVKAVSAFIYISLRSMGGGMAVPSVVDRIHDGYGLDSYGPDMTMIPMVYSVGGRRDLLGNRGHFDRRGGCRGRSQVDEWRK